VGIKSRKYRSRVFYQVGESYKAVSVAIITAVAQITAMAQITAVTKITAAHPPLFGY
jgi:hypothetical protein